MRMQYLSPLAALLLAMTPAAFGIILLDSDDPQQNTSTPGDNSGWQYEGQFGDFLGTPIAPLYFVTAHHIGGYVGEPFIFHGATYLTTAGYSDPSSDLQIWQVDHAFPDYAPLYQSGTETGLELRVFGRGTQRGTANVLDDRLRGWMWGAGDHVQRWGRNVVTATLVSDGAPFLQADFDSPGLPDEAHLSAGDSAGGVFVMEDGLWKLAAINYGVDDLFTAADGSGGFAAAIFDARGYFAQDDDGNFYQIPDQGVNVPTAFYSTRIAARLAWIQSVIGQDSSTLPPENYQSWLSLYFTPDQAADPSTTDPTADPDGDGIPNLLEFAFNLDPTYAEPAQMVADTGLRGLPLIRIEAVSDTESRLTVEFVRRTAASRPGIVYAVQWTSSLAPESVDWQAGGTESVTPINARWERVKVTDTVAVSSGAPARFARVAVTLASQIGSSQSPTARLRPGAGGL